MIISNTDNIIDSRDIIRRLEELKEEKEDLEYDVSQAEDDIESLNSDEYDDDAKESAEYQKALDSAERDLQSAEIALSSWIEDNQEELKALEDLNSECEGYGDWEHGDTLIHESYFTEYAEELVKHVGDLPRDIPDYIVIDWESTADNLKADWATVDFDGETYYIRAY